MFSWKKDPSQVRRPSPSATNVDYADLISQGLRLANEEFPDNGDEDYLGNDGIEDEGDIDIDDPELLAELHGLTGETPAAKSNPAEPIAAVRKAALAPKPLVGGSTSTPTKQTTAAPAVSLKTPSNPILADLGLSEADFEDNDDPEVELTEEDMKDPHFLSQLRSLGGVDEGSLGDDDHKQDTTPTFEAIGQASIGQKCQGSTISTMLPQRQHQHGQQVQAPARLERAGSDNVSIHRPGSTSSSLIAIPPRDRPYEYDDDDMASVTDLPIEKALEKAHVAKELPKQDREKLLALLKAREVSYKRSALDCKRANDLASAAERIKILKTIQGWIKLVEAGGFLDPDLYIIPNEPPALSATSTATSSTAAASPVAPKSLEPVAPQRASEATSAGSATISTTSMPGQLKTGPSSPAKAYNPPLATSSHAATTQVSMDLAEVTSDHLRHEHTNRRAVRGGIEIKELAKDDDFQIISNNDDDTYDMLQSQLESQIEMCKTVKRYYFQNAEKGTALKFHKLQSVFEADLKSLMSYRQHGKKAPAFHFQDVRFEVEVGYNPDIALNELELSVKRCWDLSHKDVAPSNIDSWVDWNLGWPTENMAGAGTGKGNTPVIKQTSSPEYRFSKKIGIERSRTFQNFVNRRKASFEVWHYRGIFRKAFPLGRVQVPLQPLLNHSEIHEILPLMDQTGRKPVGGKIEIEIKLQRPLVKPEIAVKEEKWLVIDEFNSNGVGLPVLDSSATSFSSSHGRIASPASASAGTFRKHGAAASAASAPTSSSTSAAASPRVVNSTTISSPTPAQLLVQQQPAAPKPAIPASSKTTTTAAPTLESNMVIDGNGEDEPVDEELAKAKAELDSADLLVSNNVLESEIEAAKQGLQAATAAGKTEMADEYQDRLMQLEIKMQLLVAQVQSGLLSMDEYCTRVKARMEKDKTLALFFKRRQMVPEAKKALTRFKIMQAEMKEVDEAMAAEDVTGGDE